MICRIADFGEYILMTDSLLIFKSFKHKLLQSLECDGVVIWQLLWQSCLPKIYDGVPAFMVRFHKEFNSTV